MHIVLNKLYIENLEGKVKTEAYKGMVIVAEEIR